MTHVFPGMVPIIAKEGLTGVRSGAECGCHQHSGFAQPPGPTSQSAVVGVQGTDA